MPLLVLDLTKIRAEHITARIWYVLLNGAMVLTMVNFHLGCPLSALLLVNHQNSLMGGDISFTAVLGVVTQDRFNCS